MKHEWNVITATAGTVAERAWNNMILDVSVCKNCNCVRVRGREDNKYYTQYIKSGEVTSNSLGCFSDMGSLEEKIISLCELTTFLIRQKTGKKLVNRPKR